jgi:hypothetical protein
MSKFDIIEITQMAMQIERDQIELIGYGPRGVDWVPNKDIPYIDHETNPLMFACAYCRKISSTYHVHVAHTDYEHEEGCLVKLMNQLGI